MHLRGVPPILPFLCLVFFGGGCADNKFGPKVKGQVLLDGNAVSEARVVFEGGNTTITDKEGKFHFDGTTFNTVKPGKYVVTISLYADKNTGKVPDRADYGQLMAANQLKSLLPVKYAGVREDNPLTAEIKDGVNDLPPFLLTTK